MLKDDGCVFCEADREDLQHFFLGCTFLFQIWCDDYCGGEHGVVDDLVELLHAEIVEENTMLYEEVVHDGIVNVAHSDGGFVVDL